MQLTNSSNSSIAYTFFSISHLCAHEHPYLQPLPFSIPRASHASLGSVAMADSRCYRSHGKTYKYGSHHEVNGSHALEDIQAYVRKLPKDAVVFPRGPEEEVPYTSIQDYVCTSPACVQARRPIRLAK